MFVCNECINKNRVNIYDIKDREIQDIINSNHLNNNNNAHNTSGRKINKDQQMNILNNQNNIDTQLKVDDSGRNRIVTNEEKRKRRKRKRE